MNIHLKQSKFLYARLTGFSLLLMAVIAAFSFGFVLSDIYVAGDLVKTSQNIEVKAGLYALGNLGWLLILTLDLVVSFGLYQIYKLNNQRLALLTALLRVVYSALLGLGIAALYQKNVETFMDRWELGLIVFGLHLVILYRLNNHFGKLVPQWIGYLLLIAGLGYGFIHGISLFMPQWMDSIKTLENVLVMPMSLSEILLALWLIRSREA